METKELKEMLFNKRKNGYSVITDEIKNASFDFSEGYKDYLNNSKTERLAVKTSIELAKKAGFENINVDLMFSLHKQNLEKWMNTLNKVIDLKPAHISAYSLIVEEGTPFYDLDLELPDEETDRKMYYDAVELLKSNGYRHYEISNFALDGFECKHNVKYWERKNYLGFGCGASGMYNNVRYQNTYDVSEYINNNVVS